MADSGTFYTMAAEAAAEIVSQKLDILLSRPELVGCFPVESLVKDAKAKLATIQGFFSSKGRPTKSTEWVGRLLLVLYPAEEFIDKFHLKVARGRHEALHTATRPLATLVHKRMLLRDMSNLVKAMKDLCQDQYLPEKKEAGDEKKKEPDSAPRECQKLARLTNFWDRQASTNFVWHGTQKEKIVERIRKEAEFKLESVNVHGISILGEKGAGKTFLARWVYREAMYLGFDMRAWVHVSAIYDPEEFLFEILKQVDKLARGAMNLKEIRRMLSQKLAGENRFLLVLDDVCRSNEELLEELAMIMQPIFWHGHIITTTQDDWIAEHMNSEASGPIKLEKLGDQESWTMLATKLRRGTHGPSLTEGDKILKRLSALPLWISLLGGLLSYDQEHAALANDDSKISVSDLLELSCHRLPVHLKPCLIYMALFPVASPIPTRRLVRLWLAEGLLDSHCCNRGRERTPEEVGETFILELADRNMIDVVSWRVDGSPKACQMLTSLYDLICPAAISTGFLYIHNASKSRGRNELNPTGQQQQLLDAPPKNNEVRWLAEHTDIVRGNHDSSQLNLKLCQIRSFLSFYMRRGIRSEDIGTYLTKMTSEVDYSLLRVLDLEGAFQPSLQGVLRKMVLLRYLGLRSTLLDSIPQEVADLQYLETLDIKHTNITSLPSSLWKARNLRHLHLNWFYMDSKIFKACRNNPMALTKLQTLSGLVIGEVKDINSLTTLTKLKFFLQHFGNKSSVTAGEMVANWISSKLTNLQSLTFGVIQEANPAEEAEPSEEAESESVESMEEAESSEESGEEATKVDKPDKEDKPAKEAMKKAGASEEAESSEESGEEATKVDKPDKEDNPTKEAMKKAERSEEAKSARSQIGPLPKLSLAEKHRGLLELYLLGQLNQPCWEELWPVSLRVLTLSGSRVVEGDMKRLLGGLPRNLRTLRLLANSFLGTSLTFAEDGFPSLVILKIWKLPQLKEVTIVPGAMLHLKELEFRHLDARTTVKGIKGCKELEKICVVVKKGARDFVCRLKDEIGETTYMYKIKEIPESRDDNEDNRYEKGKMPYLHVEKDTKRPKYVDDDDRDKKGEMFYLHIKRDIKRPEYADDR